MMVPGSNLLAQALRIIAPQSFQYYQFLTRSTQPNGQYVATYAAPVDLFGSVQAVPRNIYEQMGLNFQRNYKIFYVSKNVIDIERDVSGDIVNFDDKTYQCVSVTEWFSVDGWDAILCVQIPGLPLSWLFSYPDDDNYLTESNLDFLLNFNQNVVVTGSPYITLAPITGLIHGNAVYSTGSGTSQLRFRYVVQMTDTAVGITASSPVFMNNTNIIKNAAGIVVANPTFVVPDMSGVELNA